MSSPTQPSSARRPTAPPPKTTPISSSLRCLTLSPPLPLNPSPSQTFHPFTHSLFISQLENISAAELHQRRTRASLWAELTRTSWQLRMTHVTRKAAFGVLTQCWDPSTDAEILRGQADARFALAETYIAELQQKEAEAEAMAKAEEEAARVGATAPPGSRNASRRPQVPPPPLLSSSPSLSPSSSFPSGRPREGEEVARPAAAEGARGHAAGDRGGAVTQGGHHRTCRRLPSPPLLSPSPPPPPLLPRLTRSAPTRYTTAAST